MKKVTETETCDVCSNPLVHNQHSDGVCCDCHDNDYGHKPICHEYWDRGLNCMCIPPEENKRIASALKRGESIDDIIDPGWGPN